MKSRSAPGAPGAYLLRHWRGGNSLRYGFWVNGALASLGLACVVRLIGDAALLASTSSLRFHALLTIARYVVLAAVSIWSIVGIFRSAQHRILLGRRVFWPHVARMAVAAGLVSLAVQYGYYYVPQMIEYGRIALNQDVMTKIDAAVIDDGRTLALRGSFGTGSARLVGDTLARNVKIRRVNLNSNGGRKLEGDQVAALVKSRRMATYVEGRCESACTFVFLSGTDRAATPTARIGFHRTSFPGLTSSQQLEADNDLRVTYSAAGLSQDFIDNILRTPADQIWYPTHQELVEAGVVTRSGVAGEGNMLFSGRKTKPVLHAAAALAGR